MACFVDLCLFLLAHVLEALYGPEAAGLLAEAGEREADVPFGHQIVEAQHLSLRNIGSRYKAGAVLLYSQIVVETLMV